MAQAVQDLTDLLLQIQPAVHLALVIAAAGGVELLTHLADALDQAALDAHMNVFIFHGEDDLSAGDVCPNPLQAGDDLVPLGLGDDALLGQHGHMGHTAVNVLIIHTLVKKDGGVVFFHDLIHVFFKPAAP